MYNLMLLIWFTGEGRPHKLTLTQWHYSSSGTLVRYRLSPFCSILHHSTAQPSHISGLPNSKWFAGHICHMQYPAWNVGMQQISLFLFWNFQCGKMQGHEIHIVFSFSGYLGHIIQYQQSVHIFEEIFKYWLHI